MNRWLYRAAGTVGLAGGFLLLGAGAAQADEAESAESQRLDGLLDDVFSPTAGLPALNQPASGDQPDASTVTLDPQDGRVAAQQLPAHELTPQQRQELLPIGGLPLGGLLGSLPLDGLLQLPLDGLGLDGATAGSGLPLDGLVNTGGLPLGSTDQGASAQTLPAPTAPPAADDVSADPLTGPAPSADAQLPATIADEVASEQAVAPELTGDRAELVDGLPLVGQALGPVGNLVGVGNLAGQLPLVGPLVGPVLGGLPVVSDGATQPMDPASAAAAPPAEAPRDRLAAPERPVAGDDPMFAESAELLPTDALPALPVTPLVGPMVNGLPLVSELGVLDTLAGPVSMVRSLPLVGAVPGMLPIR